MQQELYTIVDRILVPHKAMERSILRISQCFEATHGSAEPICIALIGESRTGKTRALEYLQEQHPIQRLDDGIHAPIVRVRTPSNPTVKGLAETLLRALGDPQPDKGTETKLTNRLIKLLKASECRMLMLDEFQHFYDRQSHKVMHHVADWLKLVVDESRVALVVSGLPSCQAVLNQNEQLAGRFHAPLSMPRFDWFNEQHRDEFIAILGAFQDGLSMFEMPDLDSDEMAFRFYCATGGLIGYVAKIFRQAIWNALDNCVRTISLEDLSQAYRESVYADERIQDLPLAFEPDFVVSPTQDLIRQAQAIGTSAPEEPRVRTRRGKAENLTTSQAFRK